MNTSVRLALCAALITVPICGLARGEDEKPAAPPKEKPSALRVDSELRDALAANGEVIGALRVGVGAYRPLYQEGGRVWGNNVDLCRTVMKGLERIGIGELLPAEDADDELDYTVLWEYAGHSQIHARIYKGKTAIFEGRMPYLLYDPHKAIAAAAAAADSDAPKFRQRVYKPSRAYTYGGDVLDVGEWAGWMIAADALGLEDPDAGQSHILEFASFSDAVTYADSAWPIEVPPGEHRARWTIGRPMTFVGSGAPEDTVIWADTGTPFKITTTVAFHNLSIEYRGKDKSSAIYAAAPKNGWKGAHVTLENVNLTARGSAVALSVEHAAFVVAKGCTIADSAGAFYLESRSLSEFEDCRFLRNESNSSVKKGARAVFRNCSFEGTSVSLKQARETLFDGCSFVGCKWNGIAASGSPNVVVKDCTFKNVKQNGIFAEKGARVVVKSSSFKGSGENDYAWKTNGKVVEE